MFKDLQVEENGKFKKPKYKTSSMTKNNGKIRDSEEFENKEDIQKKFENLRRMPFSLNDDALLMSPVKNLSVDENDQDMHSKEVELLHGMDDSHLYQSFDIFNDDHFSHEIDDPRKNESEIYNKNNNVFDQANLYLNLSNKLWSYQRDPNIRLGEQAYNHNKKYNRQTTAKTRVFSGANITSADSNQKKEVGKSEVGNELTVGTYLRHKSFTTRKLNFYSDNEGENEKASNATAEIRPSVSSKNEDKKFKPKIIKGFWSSDSSSDTEINKPVIHENKTELKYDFYNSGIAFHDETSEIIHKEKIENTDEFLKKSHKNIELKSRLSFENDAPSLNKSLGDIILK